MLCVVRVFFVRMNEIDGEDGVRVRGFWVSLVESRCSIFSMHKFICRKKKLKVPVPVPVSKIAK